jgi:glycosyltransferase involved in cell wall biosynthesis
MSCKADVPSLRPSRPSSVLMVTGAYYPEISSGGVQARSMARLLSPHIGVSVLTTAVDASLPARDVVDDIPVSRVFIDVTSTASRGCAAQRMSRELFRLLPDCDVVHLHGCSSKNVLVTAIAKLFGKRIVLSLHTAGHDEPAAVRRQGTLAWWAFRAADRCMSVSPALVEAYVAGGMPASRVRHVPNGIDIDRFRPASAAERAALRRALDLPSNRPVVLFVGFFSHDKQPRVLFDAWRSVTRSSPVRPLLVFVGATTSSYFEVDESLAAGMRADAEADGLAEDVRFVGVTQRVEDFYRVADVFVLPSRREGLPVALLEAMACGVPCIASRLPGSTDVIIDDGSNGVLVPPSDPSALAQALTTVLDGPEALAATFGTAARRTVLERFASQDVAARWLAAYDFTVDPAWQ